MTKIKLGQKYKDTIHGIVGVATARIDYLTGCSQVKLEFVVNGEIKEAWFDITLIEGVKLPAKARKLGGPTDAPPSRTPLGR